MSEQTSFFNQKARHWGTIYGERARNLGNTLTILPLVDSRLFSAGADAASFTTIRDNANGLSAVFTWSEAPSAFDTPLRLSRPTNWQGVIPLVTFNGTDEEADSPDAPGWSRNDAAAAAWSLIVWANVTNTAAHRSFLAKHFGTTREWHFGIITTDLLRLTLYDESVDKETLRTSDAAIPMGAMTQFAMTYDGSGGATAGNGITLYVNGVAVASTATNDVDYVAMEDLGGVVELGDFNDSSFFSGKMAGGPLGPAKVDVALTAAQILNDYRTGIKALEIS